MSQMNLVYDIPFCFLKIHCNIILLVDLGRPNRLFNTGSPTDFFFLVRNFVLRFLYVGETKIDRKIIPIYDRGKQTSTENGQIVFFKVLFMLEQHVRKMCRC